MSLNVVKPSVHIILKIHFLVHPCVEDNFSVATSNTIYGISVKWRDYQHSSGLSFFSVYLCKSK